MDRLVRQGLIAPGAAGPLPVFPVQLIESAGNFLICAVLLWLWSRRRFPGQIAALTFGLAHQVVTNRYSLGGETSLVEPLVIRHASLTLVVDDPGVDGIA